LVGQPPEDTPSKSLTLQESTDIVMEDLKGKQAIKSLKAIGANRVVVERGIVVKMFSMNFHFICCFRGGR
jgi:hypothetical protein